MVQGPERGVAGEWPGLNTPVFPGDLSEFQPSPYPNPVEPEKDPFVVIEAPPHVSNEIWQTSTYDATSSAPIGEYVQRPAGPCNIRTGRLIDRDWPANRIWRQV